MGGEFSTDSKSLNEIEISQLVQVLLRFYDLGGTPPGGWVGGGGIGWGHPPHTCTRTHTLHVKHDKNGCLHGGSHLQFPNMFILAFCACTCMCTCLGTPPMPPDAPQPICPLSRAAGSHREPKSPKVYKS